MNYLPMPGDTWNGQTVIASGWHSDEYWGLLLLDSQSPYYSLVEVDVFSGSHTIVGTHYNIVPAARDFDKTFGFWGE